MKKIICVFSIIVLALVFSACTDDFAEINKHPYLLTEGSLQQDYNHLGAYFPTLIRNIRTGGFGDQTQHNLAHEQFMRHLATPTPFVGGVNNTTYVITWNPFWGHQYGNVFAPARQVMRIADEDPDGQYEVFKYMAKLFQITSAHRLTSYYGPIIYSDYGSPDQTIYYDSEQDLYNSLFADLDEVLAVLNANTDYPGLARFDASYGGDISKWIRYANSLRLQIAMRLVNVAPALAKAEAEKAISAPGGLILEVGDNLNVSTYGELFPHFVFTWAWGDTRMAATMESVLLGYEDPRVHEYFEPAEDLTLVDNPEWPYKGVRSGAYLESKAQRMPFSGTNRGFENLDYHMTMQASIVNFMLAEAALRGFAGTQTAQHHYEAGVRAAFAEWGAGGADAYLENDTGVPLDYVDPLDPRNNFNTRMSLTVKWDEGADNEVKLERIMTQKWIAGYLNSVETWVDHRRTGYPKIPYNAKNDSRADWGVIGAEEFIKRMPFVNAERNNNPEGVADATQKLGGPDLISTRLWWDVPGPNF